MRIVAFLLVSSVGADCFEDISLRVGLMHGSILEY